MNGGSLEGFIHFQVRYSTSLRSQVAAVVFWGLGLLAGEMLKVKNVYSGLWCINGSQRFSCSCYCNLFLSSALEEVTWSQRDFEEKIWFLWKNLLIQEMSLTESLLPFSQGGIFPLHILLPVHAHLRGLPWYCNTLVCAPESSSLNT